MPFLHPIIFWTGLAAVSVPILIHLLNRRRFKVRDWAAMKFLLDSLRKNRRRLRLEELILLAIRCMVILLLGMALGRFVGCSGQAVGPTSGSGTMTSVFVLDDSASMGQKVGTSSALSTAAGDLAQQAARIPGTQQMSVLLSSRLDGEGWAYARRDFASDSNSLAGQLRTLEPASGRMNLADSLAAAAQKFQDVQGPKRLVIASDFRRVDLSSADQMAAIRQQIAALKKDGVELTALDYGRAPKNNLTLQEIKLLDRMVLAKDPIRVEITVRNNGTTLASDVEIRMAARMNTKEGQREVSLPMLTIKEIDPGKAETVECRITCTFAGPAVITATLSEDELPADNTAFAAFEVREHMRVLVVDGQLDAADPTESESFFFTRALDPRRSGSYGCRPDVISEDALASVNFEDYDVVVLMNVAAFPQDTAVTTRPADANERHTAYPQLAALERFVRSGGGLAIFSGSHMDLRFYNDHMWSAGSGLMPFRIGSPQGKADPSGEYFRLNPKSIGPDRFLEKFQGEGGAFTGLVRFWVFTAAAETTALAAGDAGPPHVAARFADAGNSPAIATRSFGKGEVVMFYSSGSARWCDWPSDPVGTYATTMMGLVTQLCRGDRPRTALVDQPIVYTPAKEWADATTSMITPKFPKEEEVPLERAAEGRALRYERPRSAGVYTLRLHQPRGDESQVLFARNLDPAEGDLAPGAQAGITAAFGTEDYEYRSMLATAGASEESRTAPRKDYWMYFIGAVLALLAAEIFLGQRFGHYTDLRGPSRSRRVQ